MHRNSAGVDARNGYVETDPTGRYARFDDILGRGAMKTVYKAIDEYLGVEVAWNQVKVNEVFRSPQDVQRLYQEVHLLGTLNHDSIIQFYTSWIDVECRTFNFITEMFTSGTLREYRNKYNKVDIRAIKNWARQILEGLVYLHSHDPPVIHRDLKCDNVFVNGHLGQVKIGDFGLAAVLRGLKSAHSVIGTPEFMAPELYEEDYNELVDVYSFGMCVLEMLTLEYPYSECGNPAQIYKKVTAGKLPNSFYRIQDFEAQRFIGKCLATASKRLSANELLADPFLTPDNAEILHLKKLVSQKPFLNAIDLEKLRLQDDSLRTDMTIIGKLNPEDNTIFLKVQITDKNGSTRNIYFPFDIFHDTAMDVAMEMVKELEITNWDPHEIAEMIDAEISALVPNWKISDIPGRGNYHVYNYEEDDDDRSHHPFLSFSSRSSSHLSLSGMATSMGTTNDCDWLQDGLSDDESSHSSLHSGVYSNWSYVPNDDYESNINPSREDQNFTMANQKLSRFCPQENQLLKQSVARSCYKHYKELHKAPSSKRGLREYHKLTRNRSLVDIQSQSLQRSLVEELSKRRLFKTVDSMENVGFQAHCANSKNSRKPSGGSCSVKTVVNDSGKVF